MLQQAPTDTEPSFNVIPFPGGPATPPVAAMRALLVEIEAAYQLIEAGDLEGAAARLEALKLKLPAIR